MDRKTTIEKIKENLENLNDVQLKYILREFIIAPSCTHEKTKRSGDSVICANCNKDFGWFCETSPDETCHYYSEESLDSESRFITLKSGMKHLFHPDHNHKNETDDSCLFCGSPEERK